MITIVTTSVGRRKKNKQILIEGTRYGRVFETGQSVILIRSGGWFTPDDRLGKIIGFNRPHLNGITKEVLKVMFEGDEQPKNLRMDQVQIVKNL